MHETCKQRLNELQRHKSSLVQSLHAALSECGVEDFSAFEKEIEHGTTTVKSLQAALSDVKLAQKAVDETKIELQTLRNETGSLKQQLRKVMDVKPSRLFSSLDKFVHKASRQSTTYNTRGHLSNAFGCSVCFLEPQCHCV